jgi:hypothetical protein
MQKTYAYPMKGIFLELLSSISFSVGSQSYLDCDQSYLDWASLGHVSQSSAFSCAQSYLELSSLFAKLVGQA